ILSWILNVLDEGNLKDKLQAIYDKGQYSFAFLDIEWNVTTSKNKVKCDHKKFSNSFKH
uniref:Uncharacterized protein n=1 Tax=Acrobeloides nanus TaxID=290746 RepID=A0A914DIP1_9BILA